VNPTTLAIIGAACGFVGIAAALTCRIAEQWDNTKEQL
jgi:hypothetical protein